MKVGRALLLVSLLLVFLIVIGNVVLFSQGERDLSQGLVAYWKLDEGEGDIVFDETANINDGILQCVGESCSPPKWVERKAGKALEFDGEDDYIAVADDEVSLVLTGNLTIMAWIRFPSDEGYRTVVARANGVGSMASDISFLLYVLPNNHIRGYISNGTNHQYVTGNTDASGNLWHHVALVLSTTQLVLYVNGESDATPVLRTVDPQAGTDFKVFLGDLRIARTGWNFNGIIDEVLIYNRALTEDEIKELFQQGQGEE